MHHFYLYIISWIEQHQLPCLFKKIFGIDCPGCGLQRSCIALLKGNFIESFKFYPATILILILFVFLFIENKLQNKFSTKIIKTGIACIFMTILVSYIYKFTV